MELELWETPLQRQQAAAELLCCNDTTAFYGLALTPSQALGLVEARDETLVSLGRVELGVGILDKIILAFCASPYLSAETYADSVEELVECFYECKNEMLERMGDDELIARMRGLFDGVCGGSMELLRGRELPRLAQSLRFGLLADGYEGGGDGGDGEGGDDDDEY